MCKPMLVTLPFVLLLLDYWPLEDAPSLRFGAASGASGGVSGKSGFNALPRLPIVVEKLPFLLLAVASCAVAYLGQQAWVP